ncbi:MAG: LuxR C-terminal-related transcriptional regulator [Sulfuricaulis sp.]|nr:LuxR C-terminal-related transcriptional regulator [Sulfuricaulis sp.]
MPRLTRREREILRLLAQGHGAHAIAQQLHISALTVRNHIRNIYSHLGVRTRAEAISFAFRHCLL